MQLVHHARAHLHQPVPMPQQLPQIAILGVWHPDPRKAILEHQLQYELRVLPIRLLLAYSFRTNLGRISDPQLKPQLLQKSLEPARVSAGFHAHSRRELFLLQLPIESLSLLTMRQAVFAQFSGIGIDARNLLEARMVITTSFENLNHAAVLSGSRLTLSPRRCNRFTKYRCN